MREAGFDLENPDNNTSFGSESESGDGQESTERKEGNTPDVPKSRFFKIDEPDDEEDPPQDEEDGEDPDGKDGADDLTPDEKKQMESLSPENQVNFRNMRAELKAARDELSRFKKSGAPASEESEQLKKQVQELSDRLRVVDLQNHPDYQEQFVKPANAIRSEIQEILKAQDIDGLDIDEIIGKEGIEFAKALSSASDEMSGYFQRKFESAMESLQGIEAKRKSALDKSGQLMEGLIQKSEQERQQIFNKVYEGMKEQAGQFLQGVEIPEGASDEERKEIEAYNDELKTIQSDALKMATAPASAEDVASSAIKARLFDLQARHVIPRIEKEFRDLVTLNRQLSQKLKSMQGIKRTPGSGSGQKGKGGEVDETSDEYLRNLFAQGD